MHGTTPIYTTPICTAISTPASTAIPFQPNHYAANQKGKRKKKKGKNVFIAPGRLAHRRRRKDGCVVIALGPAACIPRKVSKICPFKAAPSGGERRW